MRLGATPLMLVATTMLAPVRSVTLGSTSMGLVERATVPVMIVAPVGHQSSMG
ncbi:MAG: hypothetical protein R2710_26980 [Acidimicrobiales bacterium]